MAWWVRRRKGPSGFAGSSTAEQVTEGIDGTGLTAIVTGSTILWGNNMAAFREFPLKLLLNSYNRLSAYGQSKLANILHANELARRLKEDGVENVTVNSVHPGAILTNLFGHHNLTYGHFLLTHLLLDNMKKTTKKSGKEGRIVNVASEAHRFAYREGIRFDTLNDQEKYTSWGAYGQLKLANILHAKELTRRLKDEGADITANSLHPGTITTNLFRHNNFLNMICSKYADSVGTIGKLLLKSVPQGAATTCYVALHPQVKGVSGEYFSDSNTAKTTALGQDMELARKLWDFSMSLIKP